MPFSPEGAVFHESKMQLSGAMKLEKAETGFTVATEPSTYCSVTVAGSLGDATMPTRAVQHDGHTFVVGQTFRTFPN